MVVQVSPDGSFLHLLTLEGVGLSPIRRIFVQADDYEQQQARGQCERALAGRLIVNIFFESSTRTRTAFEACAKQLGADVVNLDQITMSGETKQESLADTVKTVSAMGARGIVLRHGAEGTAAQAAAAAPAGVAVLNGGDGCHAHPTQGLTDAFTLRARFGEDLSGLTAVIVGDVLHSRVARSDAQILRTMGVCDLRVTGPAHLCPPAVGETLGAQVFEKPEDALAGADIVILLRIQRERLSDELTTMSFDTYARDYRLDARRARCLKKDAVIMHPGPINRGIEISDDIADGTQSLILEQVRRGIAIRKAVLHLLCAG